jgi:hypothetical protein
MAFNEGHALIIGVRSHKFSPGNDVPITYSDAEAVYNLLVDPTKCDYLPAQVAFLHDDTATTDNIEAELKKIAEKVKATDTVFVFFAGHGAFGTDKNYYLATHDVTFVDTGDLELKIEAGTGLSQATLVTLFKQLLAERVIFVFNACHSGSLQLKTLGKKPEDEKPKALGKSLPVLTASALLSTGTGRIVISACKPNQLSNYYPSAALTFFAKALTDGLKGAATPRKGYISAFNLYTYVYETVVDVAKNAGVSQDPMITVLEGVGPFPVALANSAVAGLSPTAKETLPETDAVLRVNKRESQEWLAKIERQTIVEGDYVKGDKVLGDKIGTQINTGGGAHVAGNVTVTGGNFIGRDQINHESASTEALGATSLRQRMISVLAGEDFSSADLMDISELIGVDWSEMKGKKADQAKALVEKCEELGRLEQLKNIVGLRKPALKKLLQ